MVRENSLVGPVGTKYEGTICTNLRNDERDPRARGQASGARELEEREHDELQRDEAERRMRQHAVQQDLPHAEARSSVFACVLI